MPIFNSAPKKIEFDKGEERKRGFDVPELAAAEIVSASIIAERRPEGVSFYEHYGYERPGWGYESFPGNDPPYYVEALFGDSPDILANLGYIKPKNLSPEMQVAYEKRTAEETTTKGLERQVTQNTIHEVVAVVGEFYAATKLTKIIPGIDKAAKLLGKAHIGGHALSETASKAIVELGVFSQVMAGVEAASTGKVPTPKDLAIQFATFESILLGFGAGGIAFSRWVGPGAKALWLRHTIKKGVKETEALKGVGKFSGKAWYKALVGKPDANPVLVDALKTVHDYELVELQRRGLSYAALKVEQAGAKAARSAARMKRLGKPVAEPDYIAQSAKDWDKIKAKWPEGSMERKIADDWDVAGREAKDKIEYAVTDFITNSKGIPEHVGLRSLEAEIATAQKLDNVELLIKLHKDVGKLLHNTEEFIAGNQSAQEAAFGLLQRIRQQYNATGRLRKAVHEFKKMGIKGPITTEPTSIQAARAFEKVNQNNATTYKKVIKSFGKARRDMMRSLNNPDTYFEQAIFKLDNQAAAQVYADRTLIRGVPGMTEEQTRRAEKFFKYSNSELAELNAWDMFKRIGALHKLSTENTAKFAAQRVAIKSEIAGIRNMLRGKRTLSGITSPGSVKDVTALKADALKRVKQLQKKLKNIKKFEKANVQRYPMNLTPIEADAGLKSFSPKLTSRFEETAAFIQADYRRQLKLAYDAGLTSSKDLANMSKVDYYSRMRWLDTMNDTEKAYRRAGGKGLFKYRKGGQSHEEAVDELKRLIEQTKDEITELGKSGGYVFGGKPGANKLPLARAQLAALENGLKEENLIRGAVDMDMYSGWVERTRATNQAVAMQKAKQSAVKLAETQPDNALFLPAIKQLDKKTGEAIGLIKEAPPGWVTDYYYVKGVETPYYVNEGVAVEWMNMSPLQRSDIVSWTGWLSGVTPLKAFATGPFNPTWGFINLQLDISHAYLSMYQYADDIPRFLFQIGSDIGRVAGPVAKHTGVAKDAAETGTLLPQLFNEGHKGVLMSSGPGGAGRRAARTVGRGMNWFGEWSERVTRVATFRRAYQDEIVQAALSKEAGRLGRKLSFMESQKIRKSIGVKGWDALKVKADKVFGKEGAVLMMRRAGAISRNRIDFVWAGAFWQMVDAAYAPYAKAAFVAGRSVYRATKANKARAVFRAANIAALTAGITFYNRLEHPEAANTLTSEDRRLHFNFATGVSYTNARKEEEFLFFKLTKDPGMRLISGMVEGLIDQFYFNEPYDWGGYKKDLLAVSPIDPSWAGAPILTGLTMYLTGRDPRTGKSILPANVEKQGWKNLDLEYNSKTHGFWKRTFGDVAGMSPLRTKSAVDQIMTYNNAYRFVLGEATAEVMRVLPETEKKSMAEKLLKSPLTRPFMKTRTRSSKYYELKEEGMMELSAERQKLNLKLNQVVDKYLDKQITLETAAKWIATDVPEDYREASMNRLKKWAKLEIVLRVAETKYPNGLPFNRKTWMNLTNTEPRERAVDFYRMYMSSTPKVKNFMLWMQDNTPGFKTPQYVYRLDKILDEAEQERGKKRE